MSMKMLRINALIILLYLVCWQFKLSNSRTSTYWRLNAVNGKIQTGHVQKPLAEGAEHDDGDDGAGEESATIETGGGNLYAHDDVFYIIATTIKDNGGLGWIRQSTEHLLDTASRMRSINDSSGTRNESNTDINLGTLQGDTTSAEEETLDCGKPVNFTYYDYLIGVGQRSSHPLVPEPEVAYLFLKTKDETAYKNFDISVLERRLKRAKREKPRSVHLYNQIGNYWRIVGNAQQAIECFRRALAMSPTNAEVLLNLARVLYNLQYLDDAIHLTRRSLEMQPPGRSAWQQYFTLGEIFKAYGHFQESILHLRHALELHPHHEPILKALRDVENNPSSHIYISTVVIIVALVVAVFAVIMTSSNSTDKILLTGTVLADATNEHRTQRHFNRAMAMRSLKGFSTARNFRHRRN